jgi:hypothetical protein
MVGAQSRSVRAAVGNGAEDAEVGRGPVRSGGGGGRVALMLQLSEGVPARQAGSTGDQDQSCRLVASNGRVTTEASWPAAITVFPTATSLRSTASPAVTRGSTSSEPIVPTDSPS